MSQYTTRIELHNATDSNYEDLHVAMEGEGFSRTIVSDNGIKYHLPWAEYNINSSSDRSQVLAAAKRAAMTTGCAFAVLVTESRGRSWDGLDKV